MNWNEPESGQLLLSPKQTAKILSISPRKLWSITASGELRFLKIGRLTRYAVEDLQSWISDQKQGGGK